MAKELVTMSRTEIDRMGVIRKVLEGRLSQGKAGELLGLGARQVRRLATAYELEGPAGLASKKHSGRPSNYRLPEALQLRAARVRRAKLVASRARRSSASSSSTV
jgi:transposase